MQNQLSKAINLVKKTGDKIIIFEGANCETAYTVMNLDEYEKLILGKSEVRGLTENELFDKINRDIAVWKSQQNEQSEFDSGEIEAYSNQALDRWSNNNFRDYRNDKFSENDWHVDFDDYDEDEELGDYLEDDDEEDFLEDNLYYYEDEEKKNDAYIEKDLFGGKNEDDRPNPSSDSKKSIWQIPREIKESAEEVIEKKYY